MHIVALVSDLIFQSKIAATAAHLGVEVRTVRTAPAAVEALPSASALIVDLHAGDEPPLELIRQARSARPDLPVVAFLSHVQVELARQAKEAGAEQVLPRSAFTEKLPELLADLSGSR